MSGLERRAVLAIDTRDGTAFVPVWESTVGMRGGDPPTCAIKWSDGGIERGVNVDRATYDLAIAIYHEVCVIKALAALRNMYLAYKFDDSPELGEVRIRDDHGNRGKLDRYLLHLAAYGEDGDLDEPDVSELMRYSKWDLDPARRETT